MLALCRADPGRFVANPENNPGYGGSTLCDVRKTGFAVKTPRQVRRHDDTRPGRESSRKLSTNGQADAIPYAPRRLPSLRAILQERDP